MPNCAAPEQGGEPEYDYVGWLDEVFGPAPQE